MRAVVCLAAFVRASAPQSWTATPAHAIRHCLRRPRDLWLVPPKPSARRAPLRSIEPLADAASRSAAGNYDSALPLASRPSAGDQRRSPTTPAYYRALAQLRLNRAADARRRSSALENEARRDTSVAAALGEGEAGDALAITRGLTIYEKLDG